MANLAKIRQGPNDSSKEMSKGAPLGSGDFDENGKYGESDEFGENSNEMFKGILR